MSLGHIIMLLIIVGSGVLFAIFMLLKDLINNYTEYNRRRHGTNWRTPHMRHLDNHDDLIQAARRYAVRHGIDPNRTPKDNH